MALEVENYERYEYSINFIFSSLLILEKIY